MEIDYSDQCIYVNKIYDRKITIAFTPYGVKTMESDYICRIKNINNKVKSVYLVYREKIPTIGKRTGTAYIPYNYSTVLIKAKNLNDIGPHGKRVSWVYEDHKDKRIFRDYESMPKFFDNETGKEDPKKLSLEIMSNIHLHQSIKDNLLLNLENYSKNNHRF